MFHPVYTYVNKTVKNFEARPILKDIFVDGQLVYDLPDLETVKQTAKNSLDSLWEEYKRDLNPQKYPVDLSTECWNHKNKIMKQVRESMMYLQQED